MISVVLSGGSGSRLWPVSRDAYPKQFCELLDQSFLLATLRRVEKLGDVRVVTLGSMKTLTENAFSQLNKTAHLMLEPLPKNTAPAVALAVLAAQREGRGQEVMGIFPADHLISDESAFQKAAMLCEKIAGQGLVVTMGVRPRYPATGYGYLETTGELEKSGAAQVVRRFHEKPDLTAAQKYASDKHFFWNAGLFFFQINKMADLFAEHMPDMWRRLTTVKEDFSNLNPVYANLSGQSLDYGVMEKMQKDLVCLPIDFGWSDVGSWDEIARLHEEKLQVASQAQVVAVRAEDNFVFSSHDKVIGLSGVNGLIVVDTPDALLITKRGESEKVKDLVTAIKAARLTVASEHRFEIRPWGRFEILSDNPSHKVKRLTVNPGAQLSYQMHERRDEHWVVISGTAEVVMDDKTSALCAGQQVYSPRAHKHRIRNPGTEPLVIVEVQTGEYFGEDDIQRFEDDYERA
jgi:mannose-1-phosphate guanylyltransferase/mannose-6-phosphate isomerase